MKQPIQKKVNLDIKPLERAFQYQFSQVKLLVNALTHSSYANEHNCQNNERMEFLGDAVLELCISERLYACFPQAQEGQLTRLRAKLVSEPTLAELARELELGSYIRLGKGEQLQGGREKDSVLSDCLEAILGAIYLDGGFTASQQCIKKLFENIWPRSLRLPKPKDYKSQLQEETQKLFGARPQYSLEESFGPEHAKEYMVCVKLPEGECLTAQASSLKKAEQKAARRALKKLGCLDDR